MMRWLILLPILSACTTAPADTSRGDRELADVLNGRTGGKTERCLERARVDGPQVIDDRTLVYRQSGRRVWLNRLPAACPSLRTDSTLIVRMFGTQMCEHDQFRTFRPGEAIAGPICRLGSFTPYDRPGG